MARTISIGAQGFAYLCENGCFYVDKTDFIRQWWDGSDVSTLVCRPRRFGKTLTLSMVEAFFSTRYAGRGEELFGGLSIWKDERFRALQGTVPVISLSFAKVKERDYGLAIAGMKRVLRQAVHVHDYLLDSDMLSESDRSFLTTVSDSMDDGVAADCLNQLCTMLAAHHGVAPIVLLDEYDTPMQEAWLGGYWDEMADFQRSLFNATFKTNPALGRALITGVTRVSRESIFSDLNNLEIASIRTSKYETCFGFTEAEVFAALDEFGLSSDAGDIEAWYDGFVIGNTPGIYNPWSITKYLSSGEFDTYWANTSGNGLVSTLVREGDTALKADFETLLQGGTVSKQIDEQVVFSELDGRPGALWGLLVSSGYVKALPPVPKFVRSPRELAITNYETQLAFDDMVEQWFYAGGPSYGEFPRALLAGDTKLATRYLADVTRACISAFDAGTRPSITSQPERFYHGLVLGLLVELRGRYAVESNRESGYGRYDVMLIPLSASDPAVIIEFKVFDEDEEQELADTVARARGQIEERAYATALVERGIEPGRIRSYGIAFRGKDVLIG